MFLKEINFRRRQRRSRIIDAVSVINEEIFQVSVVSCILQNLQAEMGYGKIF